METQIVRACEVKVGDLLFNCLADHEAFRWLRVISVSAVHADCISLTTMAWETWKHPDEGVIIAKDK